MPNQLSNPGVPGVVVLKRKISGDFPTKADIRKNKCVRKKEDFRGMRSESRRKQDLKLKYQFL